MCLLLTFTPIPLNTASVACYQLLRAGRRFNGYVPPEHMLGYGSERMHPPIKRGRFGDPGNSGYLLALGVTPVKLHRLGLALHHRVHCLQVGGVRHEWQGDVLVRHAVDSLVVHSQVILHIPGALWVKRGRLLACTSAHSPVARSTQPACSCTFISTAQRAQWMYITFRTHTCNNLCSLGWYFRYFRLTMQAIYCSYATVNHSIALSCIKTVFDIFHCQINQIGPGPYLCCSLSTWNCTSLSAHLSLDTSACQMPLM